jgi:hypothetical protein
MNLFRRRTPEEKWGIDWNSPELQPISGVSLQTYAQVNQIPQAGGGDPRAMAAERAGVSRQDWTEAVLGWQARVASNQMVQNALQLIMDPDVTPMSRWDNRP